MPPLPFILEDRTGLVTGSDFDDIYDRIFLRVSRVTRQQGAFALMIYKMPRRASNRRDSLPFHNNPSIMLEFGPTGTLGRISFPEQVGQIPMLMSRYLRRTSIFGRSLSRKFVASDGREYRWSFRSIPGQEWSCVTVENFLVAHYDLKPAEVRAYGVSGNVLTIHEAFTQLTIELLTSLTIMRHIAEHNL